MSIKDIIKDNIVNLEYYRKGYLYYNIKYDGWVWQFPVPLDDVGDATFLSEDKAILFMRYIRKALDAEEFIKVEKLPESKCVYYCEDKDGYHVTYGAIVPTTDEE